MTFENVYITFSRDISIYLHAQEILSRGSMETFDDKTFVQYYYSSNDARKALNFF